MDYKNKDWLYQKYSIEELNTYQIGRLCNCNSSTIQRRLKKLNIPIRLSGESIHLNNIKQIGNENYCNKNWLKKQYLDNKLSAIQIGELCNCCQGNIWKYLKKFNIPRRSQGEATHLISGNHCNLSDEARQWIDGELLGDGCLESNCIYSARFSYGSKYPEYIQYVSDTLKSFGIKQAGKIIKKHLTDRNMDCYVYFYHSLFYEELSSIHKRWYPERKKIIPQDLKLTPLILRQEMIGDGCLCHGKRGNPYIILATCGFLIKDVELLIKKLINLGFKTTRLPSQNSIRISSYSTKQFLDYIGKSPVKCYDYKFAY